MPSGGTLAVTNSVTGYSGSGTALCTDGTVTLQAGATCNAVDPYAQQTVLLAHFDTSSGFLTDSSTAHQTLSAVSTASQTAVAKFGTGALAMASANSYLTLPGGANFAFPAGTDFTLEAWVYADPSMSTGYAQVIGKIGRAHV